MRAPAPFYRERLIAAGLTDSNRVDLAALARLALTRRDELLRDQLDHLPHGTRRFADAGLLVRVGVTGSGTTLLVLAWSAADLAGERAAGVRVLKRIGITAGMRVANTLPGALVTPGSLLLGDVIEDIGALDVPLGAIESDAAARQAFELVDRVQPDVVVLDPASAPRLFAAAPSGARAWWRGIIWRRCGMARELPPVVPDAVGFSGWQRSWLAVPEATSFVAHSCPAARFHVDAGVVAEVVDGGLVLTPLGGDTALLRYASGVGARAVTRPCPCGGNGMVIELT